MPDSLAAPSVILVPTSSFILSMILRPKAAPSSGVKALIVSISFELIGDSKAVLTGPETLNSAVFGKDDVLPECLGKNKDERFHF